MLVLRKLFFLCLLLLYFYFLALPAIGKLFPFAEVERKKGMLGPALLAGAYLFLTGLLERHTSFAALGILIFTGSGGFSLARLLAGRKVPGKQPRT